MTLEDIGDNNTALLCITNLTACCQCPYNGSAIGNWFFPNRTRVPSGGNQWDFYRSRNQRVVLLHRKRSGVAGIYQCKIPDSVNVIQSIYIGVYNTSTGEIKSSCSVEFQIQVRDLNSSWHML